MISSNDESDVESSAEEVVQQQEVKNTQQNKIYLTESETQEQDVLINLFIKDIQLWLDFDTQQCILLHFITYCDLCLINTLVDNWGKLDYQRKKQLKNIYFQKFVQRHEKNIENALDTVEAKTQIKVKNKLMKSLGEREDRKYINNYVGNY